MTQLNGQPQHQHLVDLSPPFVPGQQVSYGSGKITLPDGTVIVRIVLVKPGHAIAVDLTAADCEKFEQQLRATRTGIILP